jgi:hypothetical protein
MKSLNGIVSTVLALACITLNTSGQTLKERIDQAKVVRVYFKNADVVSKLNTLTGSEKSGCDNFSQTTPISAEYTDALKQIIDVLNKGFNTTAFEIGNYSTIYNKSLPSMELDWLKIGEPLAFYFSTSGHYYTYRPTGAFVRENSLEIETWFYIYAVTDGKLKTIESGNIVREKSPVLKTNSCQGYDYFVKNFPLSSLAEPFKKSLNESISDFITKQMKKYEKAMKKKK